MAPSGKFLDSINSSSGISFEVALGMLETSIILRKTKPNGQASKTSSNNLSSKNRQQATPRIDLKNEDIKDEKNKRCKKPKSSSKKMKTASNISENDKENSDETGHKKKNKSERKTYQPDKQKIISSLDEKKHFDKKLDDRNKRKSKSRDSIMEKHNTIISSLDEKKYFDKKLDDRNKQKSRDSILEKHNTIISSLDEKKHFDRKLKDRNKRKSKSRDSILEQHSTIISSLDEKKHFDKKLDDRNKEKSNNRDSSLGKHTSSDYKKKNKSEEKRPHKDRVHRKRYREPCIGREAKKRKTFDNSDQTEANKRNNDSNATSDDSCPYPRDSSGKIDFERLIESGTVSIADAMKLLLDSVPEIADVSVNKRRPSIRGPEALSRINAVKHNQNKLYASASKSSSTKVPSLVKMCNAFFQDNLNVIGYTGGVPYSIMKPILEKASPGELYRIEFNNLYLIDGQTDELWALHCKRDLPYRKKPWWQSYRDQYIHYEMERLTKLGVLKANTQNPQV